MKAIETGLPSRRRRRGNGEGAALKTGRFAAPAALASAMAFAAAATADAAYQYIVSGDPVAAAAVGAVSGESQAGPLEVRERTVAESDKSALNSRNPIGTVLVVM